MFDRELFMQTITVVNAYFEVDACRMATMETFTPFSLKEYESIHKFFSGACTDIDKTSDMLPEMRKERMQVLETGGSPIPGKNANTSRFYQILSPKYTNEG